MMTLRLCGTATNALLRFFGTSRANRWSHLFVYSTTVASEQPPRGVVRVATQLTKGCSGLLMTTTSRSVFAELYSRLST